MPPRRSNVGNVSGHKAQAEVPAAGQTAGTTVFKLTIDLTPDLRQQLTDYLAQKARDVRKPRVPIGKAIIAMMTAAFTDDHTDEIVTNMLR